MSKKSLLLAHTRSTFVIWGAAALILTASALPVMAQDEASAEPAVTEQAAPLACPQSLQSITFKKDMPIKDALRMLAQMYQKNIVPSASVDGMVTVTNLYDVTFEEALQAVLGTHKYIAKGNFIRVYTNDEFMADQTRFEREMITLYYINAAEAEKLAKPLLSEFGQIGVTTPAETDLEVGESGNKLAMRDMLVVKDYPEVIDAIKAMIAEVDVMPPQVLIEVTVLKARLDETTKFGIDFDLLDVGFEGVVDDDFWSQTGFTPGTEKGMSIGFMEGNARVLISALESITDTTLLANPKILALNKQAGMVMIGDREGYVTVSQVSADGAVQQVEFIEGGTRLAFRPFVCNNGLIRMEIYPKQSKPEVLAKEKFLVPRETTTEIQTNLMVRDGKTIVIGGLFQEETNLIREQVPLLGDLPVIGQVFRGTNDQSVRTELIVLLTPHIINNPEDADGAKRLEDVNRLAYSARENITWMSRTRIDEERYACAVRHYAAGDYETALAILNSPWTSDRNWLDRVRLKERILHESQPEAYDRMERIMLERIEREESGKWDRR